MLPRSPLSHSTLRPALRQVTLEGVVWSLMVGTGETWFAAFALALGLSAVWAGMVTTLPLLIGGVLQLVTPWGVRRLRSRRRWVVLCAGTQAASFLPLMAGALAKSLPTLILLAAASIYWGAGQAAGPAWNAWMTRLVPSSIRSRFFARRIGLTQFGLLGGLIGGGALLHVAQVGGWLLFGFLILFGAALVFRATSTWLFVRTPEAVPQSPERIIGGRELWRRFGHGRDGRLLLFFGLTTTSVAVASPYFTPYMLQSLEFTYLGYMGLIGASFAAKVAILAALGKLSNRVAPGRLLRWSVVGIAAIPFLWLLGDSYLYLMVLQIIAGSFWAGYELSSFLILFQVIREEDRTSLLTTLNLLNATGMVLGSVLGGVLLRAGVGGDAYDRVFLGSGVLRVGVVIAVVALSLPHFPGRRVLLRAEALRPSMGAILRPYLVSRRRAPSRSEIPREDNEPADRT